MSTRTLLVTASLAALLAVAGCGGDNLSLCDGCENATPTPTDSPTASPTPTATATPS